MIRTRAPTWGFQGNQISCGTKHTNMLGHSTLTPTNLKFLNQILPLVFQFTKRTDIKKKDLHDSCMFEISQQTPLKYCYGMTLSALQHRPSGIGSIMVRKGIWKSITYFAFHGQSWS